MPMVVDLTEEQLAELKELTREADVTAAVRTALTEYLRYLRRLRLKELSGQVQMQEDWAELEEAELRTNPDAPGPGAD